MSFLLRKSTGSSLDLIIDHILDDVISHPKADFVTSVANLFSDSIKSSGNNLHSRTSEILSALLRSCKKHVNQSLVVVDVSSAVLVALLHHVRQETAHILYTESMTFVDSMLGEKELSDNQIILAQTVIRDLSGLRKGSRVSDWTPLFGKFLSILGRITEASSQQVLISTLTASVSLLQSANFESTTKYCSPLVQELYRLLGQEYFLSFCESMVEYNPTVFSNHLIVYVQRFIKEYRSDVSSVHLLLTKLESAGLVNRTSQPVPGKLFTAPDSAFSKSLEQKVQFPKLDSVNGLYDLFIALDIFAIAVIPTDKLSKSLPKLLERIILEVNESNIAWKKALVGKTLSLVNEPSVAAEMIDTIKESFSELSDSKIFLEGFLNLWRANKG
ncbi:hypothetical protein AWJ20_3839 [Sugiyamaella lignohabitans]|uniref:Uncharacterized protein n=1 Tax=Sugiyamaella lignohabitans TaxID=796027 RepID=A0A167C019_9ASCO|nr:uncharacterized protein AWJ20_3839 [Sugiyamaella lignohabitans]ANB11043.1 hypothetical protein AWJ20_3839 [Sugiyamaella lignohabitans]